MYKFLNTKKGFTLIELMIVVVVMGVLLAIAIPSFGALMKSGKAKICTVQVTELRAEVKDWCVHNNFNSDYNYKIVTEDGVAKVESWNIQLDDAAKALLKDDVHNSEISPCPLGGTYYITVIPRASGVPNVTVTCDCQNEEAE